MLSNLITQLTTGQSIEMSGKKMGPQIKEYNNINFPRCQRELYFNVKNVPITCSLSKGGPLLLNRTEALGAVREPSALRVPEGAPFRAALLCSSQAPSGLCSENRCGPAKPDAARTVTRGCPAQALPRGADRHLDDFVERGLPYGQGPETGIKFRLPSQVVIPSEAGSLTPFSLF